MFTSFDSEAEYYDLFETKNTLEHDKINNHLQEFFIKHNIRRIVDFSCGTGAQAIPLARYGFEVTAVDISEKMIRKAQEKSADLNISFKVGDMRSSRFGKYDACISILNSIGYLSQRELEDTLNNVGENLHENGYFIFDNTNKQSLMNGRFYSQKLLDVSTQIGSKKIARFVKGKFNKRTGIVKWQWEIFVQDGFSQLIHRTGFWKRQTYTKDEINIILEKHHFTIEDILDRNINKFDEQNSFSYLIIAKKSMT